MVSCSSLPTSPRQKKIQNKHLVSLDIFAFFLLKNDEEMGCVESKVLCTGNCVYITRRQMREEEASCTVTYSENERKQMEI